MEGDLTQDEMLQEIVEWLTEGQLLEEPSADEGWFTHQDLIDGGMTEFIARKTVKQRLQREELERIKYGRTYYYRKV